jgi:hypothetical protein
MIASQQSQIVAHKEQNQQGAKHKESHSNNNSNLNNHTKYG